MASVLRYSVLRFPTLIFWVRDSRRAGRIWRVVMPCLLSARRARLSCPATSSNNDRGDWLAASWLPFHLSDVHHSSIIAS